MTLDLNLEHMPPPPSRKDFPIGVIGAGFIVRDVHLVAYQRAGYNVVAITALDPAMAHEAAAARGIPKVYTSNEELLADPSVKVMDIAGPPAEQLGARRAVWRCQ